jgi:hypothetical protein
VGGRVARMRKMRNECKMLVRKPEGRKSFGRPKRRLENIEMNLREIVDWIHLAWDRNQWRACVNMLMNLWVP